MRSVGKKVGSLAGRVAPLALVLISLGLLQLPVKAGLFDEKNGSKPSPAGQTPPPATDNTPPPPPNDTSMKDNPPADQSPTWYDAGVLPLGKNGQPLNFDFEAGTLRDWVARGDAFEKNPVKGKDTDKTKVKFEGQWFASSSPNGDKATGTLTSVAFRVTHPWGSFLIAGGKNKSTRVEIVATDTNEVVFSASGKNNNHLRRVLVDLRPYAGKEILIRLVDDSTGSWGIIIFDDFRLHSDDPTKPGAPSIAAKPMEATAERHPVPSEDARREAGKQIKELFGDKFAKAKLPADKTKLSGELLTVAQATNAPAEQFTVLRRAEDLAADAPDVDAALAAHQVLADGFDLGPTHESSDFFQHFVKANLSAPDAQKLIRAAMADANASIMSSQFETPRQLARLATTWARKVNDKATSDRIAALQTQIAACDAEQRRVVSSIALLTSKPDDAAANSAVGAFRCFFKHDWAGGLPMLAKGNDAALKNAARKELTSPSDANEQLALAEVWWDISESQSGPAKAETRLHASKWYYTASSFLSGLAKMKADQRAAEYAKMLADENTTVAAATPKETPADPGSGTSSNSSATDPSSGGDAFTSVEKILGSVDPSLFPATITGWSRERQIAVNNALLHSASGHQATLTIYAEVIDRSSSTGSVHVDSRQINVGKFVVRVYATYDTSQTSILRPLREGQLVAASGRISSARFDGTMLEIYMYRCKLPGK
jgi:hypothetical protein